MHRTVATLVAFAAFSLNLAGACSNMGYMTHTFYGYPDNDPAGAGIAYDCGRGLTAGGTGTHDDPLTFASAEGEFDQCEIIYDAYLQKYLRYEDYCQACTDDWNNGQIGHIDVWTGSSTENGGDDQVECEKNLTPGEQSQTIVRQPSDGLPVDTTALFADGQCNTGSIYASYNIDDYCSD